MFFMMTTIGWSQSNVYITQPDADAGLDIDIWIDGAASSVGEATGVGDEAFYIKGADNQINIDLVGTNSTVTGDWNNVSQNSATVDLTVDAQAANIDVDFSVGKSNQATNVRALIEAAAADQDIYINVGESEWACTPGDTAASTLTQSDGSTTNDYTHCTTAGGNVTKDVDDLDINIDLDTIGNNILFTDIGEHVNASTFYVDITSGINNDVDVHRSGTGLHNTDIDLSGQEQHILVNQKGSGATTVKIDSGGNNSDVNVYTATAGTVNVDIHGASADVDIVIQP